MLFFLGSSQIHFVNTETTACITYRGIEKSLIRRMFSFVLFELKRRKKWSWSASKKQMYTKIISSFTLILPLKRAIATWKYQKRRVQLFYVAIQFASKRRLSNATIFSCI